MMNHLEQKQIPSTSASAGNRQSVNTLQIALILLISLQPVTLFYIYLLIQDQSRLIYLTLAVNFFLTTMSAAAYWLARKNRPALGAACLIASIAISAPVASLVLKDLGLLIGLSSLAVTMLISILTLRSRNIGWGILIGAASTVAAILIDAYANFERLDLPILRTFVPAIAAVIFILCITLILREFQNYSLRTKLIFSFLAVAIFTLGTAAAITNNLNRVRLIQNAGESLTAETNSRALLVGENLAKQVDNLQAFSLSRVIQDRVENANATYFEKSEVTIQAEIEILDNEWRTAGEMSPLVISVIQDDISSELKEYRSTFPENVEVFVTDKYGANVSATNRTSDYYQADEDWWQAAYNNGDGSAYIGQPEYDESSASYAVIIAIPLYAHNTRNIVGILRTTLEISHITNVLNTAEISGNGQIFLYVNEGKQIPTQGGDLIPGETNALALQLEIPNFADSSYNGAPSLISRAPVTSIDPEEGEIIKQLGWSLVAIQDRSEVLLQINEQTQTLTVISIVLLSIVALSAFFASQIIARPLQSLTAVTEQIAAGNFDIYANITTQDEIGALSNSFNRMADNLRQNLANLEQRIAERTADLEISRQQSEKRANELQSIGEIAKVITVEQKIENLLPLIARLVSERFGFYHTGIFLIDETNRFVVLHAASSHGGKNMMTRGYRLEVGESGIVGNVAKFGTSRIALDVGLDSVFFNNPDLPDTRSEIALPLKVRDRIVGVLDVQSEKPGAFTDEDAGTLSILADQVAIALENARLFTQTQLALVETQSLYRQDIQKGWAAFSQEEETVGYQQTLSGGKKLTQPVVSDNILQAMNRGDLLLFHADGITEESSMVVPIKLRGQIIGAMNIKAPIKDRPWTIDEIGLAEAIAERLSLALENARLIQESQRQAIKEQTISEVTGKIGASINLQNVLQTAVEELGRNMPGSEVLIRLEGIKET